MVFFQEINSSDFELEKFDFIIGEYATYNHYYKIILKQKHLETKVGLQIVPAGITPQIALFNNKMLIGAGEKFYVYDYLRFNMVKEYSTDPAFYQFIIKNNYILVISELNIFLLDSFFNKIWEKEFYEIIDIKAINGDNIVLTDIEGNHIYLNFLSGKIQN